MGKLAETVEWLRTARGWKQAELARRAGITQGMISNIESSVNTNPKQETLTKLAAAFDMTLVQLLAEVDGADTTQPPEELFRAVFSAARVQEILELWDQLSIKDRLELIEIATDMKRRLEEGNRRAESLLYHHPPLFNPAFDK